MEWLLMVAVLNAGVWQTPPQQPPTPFTTEKECRYWAETIERGWQRVESGYTYTVSCSPVYVSKERDQ